MLFMRASSKVQQDKSKNLVVSVESIKAELSGYGFRDFLLLRRHFDNFENNSVTLAFDSDERQLSQRLQQQLNEVTMELQQRTLDFELGGGGAAAQRMQQERNELAALRACNDDLLAEVRALQKDARAKEFLLAAQKAAAAATADKSSACIQDLKEQVVFQNGVSDTEGMGY